jgi:long-chain acyl-CoA synthetase
MSDQVQTLSQALLAAMDDHVDRTCFRVKRGQRYRDISYRRFRTLVYRLSSFYLDYGLTEGDRVVLIADNCLEWMVAYVACLVAGGAIVPVPTSLTSDMMCAILKDVGARLVIVHDDRQSRILESIVQDLPELETVIAVNEASLLGAFSMSTVLDRPISAQDEETIRTRASEIDPQALAAIHYTTGKTDRPRGAMFDQAQRLAAMQHLAEWLTLDEDDLAFAFVPWSYMPSLDASLRYFLSGTTNVLSTSRQATYEGLQQTSPTLGLLPPSVLEEFYNMAIETVNQWPRSTREVFAWALAMSKEFRTAGLSASQELHERHLRADMTFFSQIRGWLGGRLRRVYSVGAPLALEVAEFLEAIGLTVLDIYNITEAGGFPAISRPESRQEDSVGRVASGYQIRIAEDGEVLVRGETVMRGYWRLSQDTEQVIDADGWLHTGDLGRFDSDGYLYLTGNKQPLIVLTTGRKVVPTTIESALVASPFVDQAVVFGDGQLYVSALIVPNTEAIVDHFRQQGEESGDLRTPSTSPTVRRLLDDVIEQVNSQLARWERVRGYSVLDQPLDEAAEDLTGERIDRQSIADRYTKQLEAMHRAPARLAEKALSQVEVEPEELRALVEKRDILDAWIQDAGIGFLLDLAREKQINGPSMVSICDTVAAIAQMQSEEKPLSTALIVGDPARIARVLPQSEIQLHRYDLVRRMRQVVLALTKMVDGLVLGYGLDKHGVVRGIHKLDVEIDTPKNSMLGPWFRRHAAISYHCDAVVLFVPPGGRQVRVFADGQPVGRYVNGNWSPESVTCDQDAVQRLAEQKGCSLGLLQKILRCAFLMSEKNLGAIFVVGDSSVVLGRSDSSELSTYATIVSANVRDLTDDELINFAKQDGATVIDADGRFRGCMVLLRPSADTKAEIGLGKGARHSSAAKISAEAQSLAIAVSQDGPITVYDNGRRVLSL